MTKGYCHLTLIPIRKEAKSGAEVISQLLYGETYTILESIDDWHRIRMDFDGYEGWLSDASICLESLPSERNIQQELFSVHPIENRIIITSMGSEIVPALQSYEEELIKNPVDLAMRFLGAPYLWGGRSFTGIDCSGLTQVVYKCLNIPLQRDAYQQQKQGKALRFEDITAGDLVFFESNANITHVGIALSNSQIIHAHGSVRIDTLKKKGIWNESKQEFTHAYHSAKRVR